MPPSCYIAGVRILVGGWGGGKARVCKGNSSTVVFCFVVCCCVLRVAAVVRVVVAVAVAAVADVYSTVTVIHSRGRNVSTVITAA